MLGDVVNYVSDQISVGSTTETMEGLISLGDFQFSVSALAYNHLRQQTQFNWVEVQRALSGPVYHRMGSGAVSMDIEGVFYPQIRGGYSQLPQLKQLAAEGPLVMVDADGNQLGLWVINSIDEDLTKFDKAGRAKRVDFNIRITRYSE